MKKLLLTGATGFLGGAVLEKLLLASSDFNYLLLVR
ncbi:NAD dependent epimerase/dehydratase family protein, partial [Yersinia pestis PY-09]